MPNRTRLRLALLAAPVVLAAACTHAPAPRTVRVQRPVVTTAPTPIPPVAHPLTGVLFSGPQAWQLRPALAIKVENLPASRPQAGLDGADVVYEELAEGGITRFIAIFQSEEETRVGPVRSARRVDPDVLAAFGGLFAYAGGVPPVVAAVKATPSITDVGFNAVPGAYWRRTDRVAPHNLYTSTASLWSGRHGGPPTALFSFLEQGQTRIAGTPGAAATFSFAPNEETRYVYDAPSGTYRRFHGQKPHQLEDGRQVSPTNVLFQRVQVAAGSTVDVNGQRSPESKVLGEGEAVLLSGGYSYHGRWVRQSLDQPTQFLDDAGNILPLTPGQTWVELLPDGRPLSIA